MITPDHICNECDDGHFKTGVGDGCIYEPPADAGAAERLVEEEAMEQKRTDFNILVHMITGAGIPCEWTSKTIFIGPPGDHQIQIAFDEHGKLIDIFTE